MKFVKFIVGYWRNTDLPFHIKLADLWSYLYPSRKAGTPLYGIRKD